MYACMFVYYIHVHTIMRIMRFPSIVRKSSYCWVSLPILKRNSFDMHRLYIGYIPIMSPVLDGFKSAFYPSLLVLDTHYIARIEYLL